MAGPPGCASGTARPLEPLALTAGLIAGRDDLGAGRNALCDGSERYADHRQSRRDGAYAGEHGPDPSNNGFFFDLTSRRKPDAIADGVRVSAIFPDVSIRSHRFAEPCGIGLPAGCGKPERRQNPLWSGRLEVAHWTTSRARDGREQSAVFPRCGKRLREEGIPSGGEVRRVPALRPRVFGNGERHTRPACPREPAADGAGVVSLGRQDAGRRERQIPSGRRLKSRWLGLVREF